MRPARKRDIIERAQERFGIDPAPFTLFSISARSAASRRRSSRRHLLAAYLNEIGKVIDAVDVLEKALVAR